ncbi:MAG: lactate utilization protein [Angelakisella sp.]
MDKNKLMDNLQKKGFQVEYFETSKEAVQYMTDALSGKTIGIGGSETVKALELDKALMENNTVYWHWLPELIEKYGTAKTVRDMANGAEIYISSANAIAETGEIVNIDGTGNRISATAYGHEKVYFIVGTNKVTETLEGAIWRARNIAAPKNAKRLNKKTPCAQNADKCYDCNSSDRICNGLLLLARPMSGMEMVVVLINEELGA